MKHVKLTEFDEIIKRLSDGVLFLASCPDEYDRGQALADFFSGKLSWYFREVKPVDKKWWQKHKRYVETGEIWEPKSGSEFKVTNIGGTK